GRTTLYVADRVGTQTETLTVRGLSVGVPIRLFVGKQPAGLRLGVHPRTRETIGDLAAQATDSVVGPALRHARRPATRLRTVSPRQQLTAGAFDASVLAFQPNGHGGREASCTTICVTWLHGVRDLGARATVVLAFLLSYPRWSRTKSAKEAWNGRNRHHH